MLQEILVIAIIASAVAYTLYSVFNSFRKKSTGPCGDCTGCEVKKEFMLNYKKAKNPTDISCYNYQRK
jgi:hypothetical protein